MSNKINAIFSKKLLLFVFVFLFFGISISSAYNATARDTANLNNLKWQLDNLVEDNNINLLDFYHQVKKLETSNTSDERLFYMLSNLKSYLYNKLFTAKTIARVWSKTFKENFVSDFGSWISLEVEDSLENCIGWYNTLDDISFAYDFPTALTMATWYRESRCAYYLPNNWDGPFQIVNKDYGTGELTEDEFITTVIDFMEFTKAKFARYEGQLSGELTYTWFDLKWISNFAALYNGWTKSGNVVLSNSLDYLMDGYGDEFSGATRYGVFPQFVKALEWEIENSY